MDPGLGFIHTSVVQSYILIGYRDSRETPRGAKRPPGGDRETDRISFQERRFSVKGCRCVSGLTAQAVAVL